MRCIIGLLALVTTAAAFSPPQNLASGSVLFRPASKLSSTQVNLAAVSIPNPLKKLPWNAAKDRARASRRLKQETAKLHRELGIVDDATYEELTEATNAIIAKCDGDMKKKVKTEIARDRILQIRLNARLAGLSEIDKDARIQSNFEKEGADDEDVPKKQAQEWNAPRWTQNLIVKPNKKWGMRQVKFWGALTAIGTLIPPAIETLGSLTWLFCVGMLTFRGVNTDDMEGGMFARGPGGSHKKVAWLIGISTWIFSSIIVYGVLPPSLRNQRITPLVVFPAQNLVYGLVCAYVQPYKGD